MDYEVVSEMGKNRECMMERKGMVVWGRDIENERIIEEKIEKMERKYILEWKIGKKEMLRDVEMKEVRER